MGRQARVGAAGFLQRIGEHGEACRVQFARRQLALFVRVPNKTCFS
jgi:hypothetical protein